MRTLLFTLEFPPFNGGIANYYGNLTAYWPLGENLVVLNNNQGDLMRRRGFLSWWPAIHALKEKIALGHIDFVLVGQILPLGTAAWILSLSQTVRYGVFLHGLDLSAARRVWHKRLLARMILARAEKIVCANSFVAAQAAAFVGSNEKISIINPGVQNAVPSVDPADIAEITKRHDFTGQTLLFSLGRLVRRKGFDMVIQALASMPVPSLERFVYCIAGAGQDEERLRQLVPEKLFGRVIFVGDISETEKWAWLKLCDIFIMPSRNIKGDFEGFGLVYLEANLSAKPVIAGDAGGVRDAVIDGQNGLLVNPEDVVSIREAIIKLADDPARRERLGRFGQERALQDFSWERQAAKLAAVLKNS